MATTVSTEVREIKADWEPNLLTRETMEKSERGEGVHHATDAEELFKKLNI